MIRRVPALAAAFALTGALVLTGCEATTSHSCRNGECHVTVTGTNRNLEINDYRVRVLAISADSATFSVEHSQRITIPVGASDRVGPVHITVTSINGETLKFDMQ